MPFKQRTKRVIVYDKEGNEIGYVIVADTRRRWRAIGIWIIVFTLVVFFGLYKTRSIVEENNTQAISLIGLEKAGCNTRIFLVSSRGFRLRSYHNHKANARKLHGQARQKELVAAEQDLEGARLSRRLADNFAPEGCAKRLGLNPPNRTQ